MISLCCLLSFVIAAFQWLTSSSLCFMHMLSHMLSLVPLCRTVYLLRFIFCCALYLFISFAATLAIQKSDLMIIAFLPTCFQNLVTRLLTIEFLFPFYRMRNPIPCMNPSLAQP